MGENSLMHALLSAAVASSLAVLVVGMLRVPLRKMVGARAAYWLWLLIPTMVLATLLPAPSESLQLSSHSLAARVGSALSGVVVAPERLRRTSIYVTAALALWAAGAAVMFGLLLRRQRIFVRSLGKLSPDSGNVQRSAAIVAPMLVGAWRSKVILPIDFESRYSEAERTLMLAHERAHLLRRDVFVNVVAAGWLCFFWFNPLIYWAIGMLRLDQELACDAVALAGTGAARHCYADALLKTQLASESGWQMPLGCRWQSGHPLKERVAMLKRRTPSLSRRLGGVLFVLALSVSGSYAAWAAQSAPAGKGAPVFVSVTMTTWTPKIPAGNPPAVDVRELMTAYKVYSGETPPYPPAQPLDFRCTPFLPKDPGQSPARVAPGGGAPSPASGQIFLQCKITYDGKVVGTPSLLALDGRPTSMKVDDKGRALRYQLVVTASTSKERFEAARSEHEALSSTDKN